jgi:hypothetical protein
VSLSGRTVSDEVWFPLFANDERLWDQITLDCDLGERIAADGDMREILAGIILKFGNVADQQTLVNVGLLYRACVDAGMPLEHRWQVFLFLTGAVQHTTTTDVGMYMPFIFDEPHTGIVSTATIDYASLGSLIDNDPMGRPKELVQLVQHDDCQNRGAVFGGLLLLGDPRVCALLKPLIGQLSLDDARQLGGLTTGMISAATIDFILNWMEGLEGEAHDVLFGALASNLIQQKRRAVSPLVRTGLRPFPINSVSDEEQDAISKWVPFETYARTIAPRLLALELAEPPPKVMSAVIHTWGIAERDLSAFEDHRH